MVNFTPTGPEVKKYSYPLFILFFISFFLSAQRGKDGARTVTAANTNVNAYTTLTADAIAGATSITVASSNLSTNFSGNLSAGDLIMIIQMQGAAIRGQPDQFTPTIGYPNDSTWGGLMNYNNTGRYEFAQVSSVPNNATINLDCGLQYNYTAAGRVQVIRVPRYTTLTINNGGILTCPVWNGATGGVLAVEAEDSTKINAGGKVDATGKGFRGGVLFATTGRTSTVLYSCVSLDVGTNKGEGIAGYENDYTPYGGRYCRGAAGNAGGGGNVWNCGGGGGANAGDTSAWNGQGNPDTSGLNWARAWNLEYPGFAKNTSSGGGRGGYAFSDPASNQDATTLGPAPFGSTNAWGGSYRYNLGGLGGRPLDYSTGRIFMGGGGGAGEQDNNRGGAGGNGGGIIYFLSYSHISGADSVISNGANGASTQNSQFNAGRDGAGGGGGGGAVILKTTGTVTGIVIAANGGRGGNQIVNASTTEAEGPGGGGGGGYIAVPPASVVIRITNGGANGTTNSGYLSEFPSNGATRGGAGISNDTIRNFDILTANPPSVCPGQQAVLTATLTGTVPVPTPVFNWYTSPVGGAPIGTGSPFVTGPLNSTTTFYVGTCQGSFRKAVTVNVGSISVSASASPATICAGGSTILSASGASNYTWSPSTGLSGTAGSSVTASPTSTTVYTVTGISGSCSNTSNVTVTVGSINVMASASPATICAGGSTILSASGASNYTWSPSTGLSGTTGSSVTASPTSTTVYTVIGISGSCSNTSNVTVTVGSINVTASASPATICAGGSTILSASGASNYTWSPSTGLSGTAGSSVTASPTSTTVYTVTGISGSCSNTSNVTVTVGSINVTASASPATICPGGSTILSASGASNYTWSPSTGLSGTTGSMVTASPSASITYTVIGVSGTCSNMATLNVTVSPVTLTLTPLSAAICGGGSASLSASGATNYTWSPGNSLSGPGAPFAPNVTASPSVTTTYTVTGTSGSCSATSSVTVNVTSVSLSVSPGNNLTVCPGTLTTLVASGATDYSWAPAAGLYPTTGSTVNASPATSTNYTVTGSSGSCSNTLLVSIIVSSQLPVAVSPAVSSICAGGSAVLTASGANTYTWAGNGLSATTGSTVTANPSVTTTYTVTGSSGNCSNSSTAVVNVVASLILGTNPSSVSVCPGGSVTLTATGASNYTWQPSSGLSSSTGSTVTAAPTASTTYIITGTSGGCSATSTVMVTVANTLAMNANPSTTTICPGAFAILTATGASNYTWSPSSGLSTTSGSSVTASPSVSTTYTVLGFSGTCSGSVTVAVTVSSNLPVGASASPPSICQGKSTTLTASGAQTYTWIPAAGLSSSVGTTVTAAPASSVTYTLIGSSGSCSNSAVISLTVSPQPTVDAGSNVTITSGSSTTLLASTGGASYSWFPSSGLSCTNCQITQASPLITTTYYVMMTNGAGCTALDSVTVSVNLKCGDVFVPNAFSPNGDNNNDLLEVYGKSCIRILTLIIYDRWGEKIIEIADPAAGWDGKYKGKDMDPGVFVYYLNAILINNEQVIRKGNVTLVR